MIESNIAKLVDIMIFGKIIWISFRIQHTKNTDLWSMFCSWVENLLFLFLSFQDYYFSNSGKVHGVSGLIQYVVFLYFDLA